MVRLRILDRYVAREVVIPFSLALIVLTFILQIPPVAEVAEKLLAKGVDAATIGRIMLTLLPQALGVTIPMALLVGLLVALGRLSGDREAVAMQACGVSLYRLLVPVGVVALVAWAATSWILIKAMPEANQTFREITFGIVAARAESEVKPRVFFEDFPNLVLYVRDIPADGRGWNDVFLADTRKANQPEIFVARQGQLVIDREQRRVDLVLRDGTRHSAPAQSPAQYEVQRFADMTITVDPATVFPRTGIQPGPNEMTIADLQQEAANRVKLGLSPHNELMAIQKKYSIPVACFVFAVLGLGLGVTSRKDSKQSSFVVAIAVIFAYYVLMYMGEAMAKGHLVTPTVAMWLPNILLGLMGFLLLSWRARYLELSNAIAIRVPWRRRVDSAAAGAAAGRTAAAGPATLAAGSGGRSPARRDVVVVIRIPQFSLPGPRLLDAYLMRGYLRVFLMAFVGMLGIFYIATFIDLSDKLFKGQATGGMLVRYFWYATPQFVYYVMPIAALISTLVTVGVLTKSSELTVMKACGISLYRAAMPIFLFGLLWSGALFGLEETVLAHANRKAQELRHVMRGGSPRTFDVLNRQWIAGRNGGIYNYMFFDPRKQEMSGLSIFRFDDKNWRLTARSFTGNAVFQDGAWKGMGGWRREFSDRGEVKVYAQVPPSTLALEPVDYFMTEHPDAERMNYGQLKAYIGELRVSGFNVVPYTVELQRKLSFPFVTVVMSLLAVPFAVTTGRRGALYGIGLGIVLAIAYWLLFSLFSAIGTAGLLTPMLAAWAPNILFTVGAASLLLTVRT
jgi:LPS export ABC transporter permease LptG/LPS export ABC transporter permease LptF